MGPIRAYITPSHLMYLMGQRESLVSEALALFLRSGLLWNDLVAVVVGATLQCHVGRARVTFARLRVTLAT